MEVLILPVIFGVAIAVIAAALASSRRHEAQWRAAAQRLHLTYSPGKLFSRAKIHGAVGDLNVTVDTSSSSSGSSSSVRTRYRVTYPSLGLNLRMSRQSGLAKAAALFGVSDITVGDTRFDEAFSIKTSDPQRLAARLSPSTRAVLLDLVTDFRAVKISDEQIGYEKNGIDRETGTVVTTAQRLIEAARALQGASASAARSAPPRERAPQPSPEPQTLLTPDPFDAGTFTEPPLPPVLVPPRPAAEQPVESEPAATPLPSTSADSPTADQVASQLFGSRGLSFQIAKTFEERYQGLVIEWQGTLRKVVTAIGPGDRTRVTVLVASVPHQLFGTAEMEIVAEVAAREARATSEGATVRVRGSLSGIDAMSRRLIVEDAQLI